MQKLIFTRHGIYSNMKNLILGGEGTIGSALVRKLKQVGEEVESLDLKSGFDARSQSLEPYKNVDFVWFLAWDVGGFKFLQNKNNHHSIILNNTQICENVFTFLERNKLPFLFASSQLAATDSPYGITKLLGEEWTRILGGQTARFWNVYGWEPPGERSHVIPDLILQALNHKKVNLLSHGNEVRQFMFMDDCVNNLLEIRNRRIPRVDLSNGEWITILEVAKEIGKQTGAQVIPGSSESFSIKIEPDFSNYECTVETPLHVGIAKVIREAQLFIKSKKL